jgi:hypothetical protein
MKPNRKKRNKKDVYGVLAMNYEDCWDHIKRFVQKNRFEVIFLDEEDMMVGFWVQLKQMKNLTTVIIKPCLDTNFLSVVCHHPVGLRAEWLHFFNVMNDHTVLGKFGYDENNRKVILRARIPITVTPSIEQQIEGAVISVLVQFNEWYPLFDRVVTEDISVEEMIHEYKTQEWDDSPIVSDHRVSDKAC